jgi:phosphate/sulfate permease
MEKTPEAEQLLLTVIDNKQTAATAEQLVAEGFKMRSGEFREAFLSLAAEVHEQLGNAEGAAHARADVKKDYEANIAREEARILPKVPILGPVIKVEPTDWIKTLENEREKAQKDGKPPLKVMASKVRELAPDVPVWIKVVCALTMAAGTSAGGWRIIKTMGHKMVKLQPVHGFAAETTAATLLAFTGKLGMTVSTTHAITTAIMGVGATKRFSAIDMNIVRKILGAWVLTLPAAFGVAYVAMWLWLKIGG